MLLVIAGLRGIGYQWLLDPDGFDPVSSLAYLHDTTRLDQLGPDMATRTANYAEVLVFLHAMVNAVRKLKPQTSKGAYFKKVILKGSMTPAVHLAVS